MAKTTQTLPASPYPDLLHAARPQHPTQQSASIGSWKWDICTNRLTWSDGIYQIFGVNKDFELTYECIEAMIHPDDRATNTQQVRELLTVTGEVVFEFRIVRRDGLVRHIVQTAQVERDENAQVLRAFGIMQDVTELRHMEQALYRSQQELMTVYENAPVMMCLLEPDRKVLYANRALTAFMGVSEGELAQGRACGVFGCINAHEHPDGCGFGAGCQGCQLRLAIEDTLVTGQDHRNIEYRAVLELAGVRRHIVLLGATARIETGESHQVLLCLEDITERKQAVEALRESEERYRSLIEEIQDGVFVLDREWRYVVVNAAAARVTAIPRGRLLGGRLADLFPESEHTDFFRTCRRVMETRISDVVSTQSVFEDGRMGWYEVGVFPIREGILCIARDITERRQAEEALHHSREQLRALAGYLQSAHEKERAHIAREVHDELGQVLTALKIDLSCLGKRLTDQTPLANKVEDMIALVDGTIGAVRRMATELRPGLLDDLGLIAALEWQVDEFARRTGLKCRADFGQDAMEDVLSNLDRDLATAIFRIVQESLTNVARHARATEVEVSLRQAQDVLILTVRDNGIGLAPESMLSPDSLGLLGMRERALAWQGSVGVESVPGQGTTVTLRVPYAANKEQQP